MKIEKLQRIIREKGCDGALFFGKTSYATYAAGVEFESGCIVIPAYEKPVLFIPGFEAERIKRLTGFKVVQTKGDLFESIAEECVLKEAGVIPSEISMRLEQRARKKMKLIDIEEECIRARVVKTANEIEQVTKACAITDAIFSEVCSKMHACRTEKDLAMLIRMHMDIHDVMPSFPIIVATGLNAKVPHHVPNQTKLAGFTVIDFGVKYNSYCSDMTRTVFFGEPSDYERLQYEQMLLIQHTCIDKMTIGTDVEDVNSFAKEKIKSMVHRVSHSLGIEVHDPQPKPFVLQEGTIVTCEPGMYSEKAGIRIEDDIIILKQGPCVLTQSSKEFISVKRI